MKTKKILTVMILCMSLIGITSSASALVITPATAPQWTTNVTANLNAADVATLVGYPGILFEVYKQNQGDATDTGSYASSYQTSFDPLAESALIVYVGGAIITGDPLYLLVKDGSQGNPAQYVFDLSALNWNGTENIELQNFWSGVQGSISHIAIYSPSTTVPVPEPATLLLLGSGLLGLWGIRRKFKK